MGGGGVRVVKELMVLNFDKAIGSATRRCFIRRGDLWLIVFNHSHRQTYSC